MKFAHDNGFIHMDIKPSNVLVFLDKSTGQRVYRLADWFKKLKKQFFLFNLILNFARGGAFTVHLSSDTSLQKNKSTTICMIKKKTNELFNE